MAFFLVRIFLLVIRPRLNEVFPKLNLPFLKGYSPNKMNRKGAFAVVGVPNEVDLEIVKLEAFSGP